MLQRAIALLAMLLLTPPCALAIQLRWASGGHDLVLTAAARCTLIVQADDAETSLPREWRLLQVADTAGIVHVTQSGPDSCGLGVALPATMSPPLNAFETEAGRSTLSLCSLGSGRVYLAWHVLDIPAGVRAKFRVVAIDRTDPSESRVIQSSEVTLNGGVPQPFSPAILRVATTHQSTEYALDVIGAGLAQVEQASLAAPDGSWEVPLAISSQSDSLLHATASLAAWVPDSWLVLRNSAGMTEVELVVADPPPPALAPQAACQARFIEDIYPPAMIQPKDFAMVPGGWSQNGSWTFHLFYIRQNQVISNNPTQGAGATEKNLGHAVSNDLQSWTVLDTAAIGVRPGGWDSFHVWAPTIIRRGVRYYMFYTGVDTVSDQRVGVATSLDLVHWEQGDTVLTAANGGPWVQPEPSAFLGQTQFRDPFVMVDPVFPDSFLIYFTARAKDFPGMAIGFARISADHPSFNSVGSRGVLWRSQQNRASGLESPHVFQREGRWWVFFTKPIASQDTIYAFSSATSPTDTVTANWSPIRSIRELVPLGEATAYTFWHATEYLKIAGSGSGNEYLAGFNDSDQSITYTQMNNTAPPALFAGGCPSALDVGGGPLHVETFGIRRVKGSAGQRGLALEISLPAAGEVDVTVFDVMGRKVRVVGVGRYPAGRSIVVWDGSTDAGVLASSGVYFASVTKADSRASVRAAFLK